jgi:hypothetical protein
MGSGSTAGGSTGLEIVWVGLALLLYLVSPTAYVLLAMKRTAWRPSVPDWRWILWQTGFCLGLAVSCLAPLFLAGIQLLPERAKNAWFIDWSGKAMFAALLLTPIGLVLLGFGRGRQRWIGLLAGALTAALLYISLLAMSD